MIKDTFTIENSLIALFLLVMRISFSFFAGLVPVEAMHLRRFSRAKGVMAQAC